ncbi:suppressor of swi4 1 [Anaeramoeba ignava]|uniref:Suppressor of swi4 1 n=1 Tax=Anaeramoeba ignava TaxID=1746090 RepID=A0A9Q0RCK5_ANAIG|nr:suppressor of swi4 1 [Anaeramoeba ignava]
MDSDNSDEKPKKRNKSKKLFSESEESDEDYDDEVSEDEPIPEPKKTPQPKTKQKRPKESTTKKREKNKNQVVFKNKDISVVEIILNQDPNNVDEARDVIYEEVSPYMREKIKKIVVNDKQEYIGLSHEQIRQAQHLLTLIDAQGKPPTTRKTPKTRKTLKKTTPTQNKKESKEEKEEKEEKESIEEKPKITNISSDYETQSNSDETSEDETSNIEEDSEEETDESDDDYQQHKTQRIKKTVKKPVIIPQNQIINSHCLTLEKNPIFNEEILKTFAEPISQKQGIQTTTEALSAIQCAGAYWFRNLFESLVQSSRLSTNTPKLYFSVNEDSTVSDSLKKIAEKDRQQNFDSRLEMDLQQENQPNKPREFSKFPELTERGCIASYEHLIKILPQGNYQIYLFLLERKLQSLKAFQQRFPKGKERNEYQKAIESDEQRLEQIKRLKAQPNPQDLQQFPNRFSKIQKQETFLNSVFYKTNSTRLNSVKAREKRPLHTPKKLLTQIDEKHPDGIKLSYEDPALRIPFKPISKLDFLHILETTPEYKKSPIFLKLFHGNFY